MDDRTKNERLRLFEQRCREDGMPITVQRRLILEAVLSLDHHPTADQVHEAVGGRLPQISRTTVYRTLETLVRMGVITKACHPGSVVRYDSRTENHHHLICLCCDLVTDAPSIQLGEVPLPDVSDLGFEISDVRVQLRGICCQCRKKEEG
jgi:Fur family peroxide stress response transcriptional regulator